MNPRSRLMPRDEHGNPRRFRGHGEALKWTFVFIAKYFASVLLLPLVFGLIIYLTIPRFIPGTLSTPIKTSIAVLILAFLLLIYIVVALALYSYVALAGGIMSREERERRNA